MSEVRFEPQSHQYFLPGGKRLPSVTQILKEAGLIPENDRATFERGKRVHELTHTMDMGYEAEEAIGDIPESNDVIGMLGAWENFKKNFLPNGFAFHFIEEPIASEIYGFAGTPDRIVWNSKTKRYQVIEIKTGAPAHWHRLQTSGYKLLFSMSQKEAFTAPVDRIAVYLNEDGSFTMEQHDYPLQRCTDKDVFMAALALTQWRIKHNCFWKKEN